MHSHSLSPLTKAMAIALMTSATVTAHASNNLAGGVWFNYNYNTTDGADNDNNGNFGDEALILYADGAAEEGKGNWSYSAELRVGPGSFTDPDNNSTGDQTALHKAWLGFDFAESHKVIIGKSQVPFGWKTSNFWPGDMLQAGYGDQMDIGLKLTGDMDKVNYSAAYYHQDDWGTDSTDTVDDNGHWGSSTTYRKVQTLVGDLNYPISEDHRIGVSLQSGKLQNLVANTDHDVEGSHQAGVLYYKGSFGKTFVNAEVMKTQRELPDTYVADAGIAEDQKESTRYAATLGRTSGNWTYYVDASWAQTDTSGNDAGTVYAYAPGVKYNYGPGWIYAEYLDQSGYVGRNGDSHEGNFSALYLTIDFYF
ncbi:MAG: hypothetical protein RI556_12900 [Hydrogenovibrio sp.]|uniref:hypothetical protein n=1 Tax=Hydrogenovibrio sp. TaxID=2065821 RepID=UPI0028709F6B|nr:hypothetical protein [Hydrogenovibrio sp.]MDR9500068.1 hypothetical protein [Hydrogenovibrio sp.]